MFLRIIQFTLVSYFLFSCGGDEGTTENFENAPEEIVEKITPMGNGVTISGFIKGGEGKQLKLDLVGGAQPKTVGTGVVDENGKFILNASTEGVGFYNLGFERNNSILLYLTEDEDVELTAEAGQLFQTCVLTKANESSNLIAQFFSKFFDLNGKQQIIGNEMQALAFEDNAERKRLNQEFETIRTEFTTFKKEFVDSNPKSPVLVTLTEYFDPATEAEYLDKILAAAETSLSGTPYFTTTKATVEAKKMQAMASTTPQRIAPGQVAPDLAFPDPNGTIRKLSDLKGKVILLDFWASWCGPCRKENPTVVRVYNEYKSKGFEIMSFSLDKDANKWKRAIEADGLIWPNHISDLMGWQTAAGPIYGVKSIPMTVLIGKDGKIIETGLRGHELEKRLKQLLG